MGTKRDPSSPLDKVDGAKKQNTEHVIESQSTMTEPSSYQQIYQEIRHEMDQLKAGLRDEIATASKKVGDELRDEIAMVSKKIGEICLSHGSVLKSLQFHSDYLETIDGKVSKIDLGLQTGDKRMDKIDHKLRDQGSKLNRVDRDIQDYGRDAKAKNIVINGLTEKKGENTAKVATTFLKVIVPSVKLEDVETAYRMGAPGEMKRSILVKFKSIDTKKEVMAKKSSLKDKKKMKKVYCNEDLPEPTRKLRQKLREIGRFAIKCGYKDVKVTGNRIQVDGTTYFERDLKLLPTELQIENIKVRLICGRICFESDMAYLSSSYLAPVKMNEILFCSAEQAFFYQMAIYTGRTDYASEILEHDDTKSLKKMGKKMGQDKDWEAQQLKMLKGITILKFQQNPALLAKLLETGEAPFYNCDLDSYWGTGRSMDSTQWDDLMQYTGRNALGVVLEDVRNRLKPPGYGLPEPRPPILDLSALVKDKPNNATGPLNEEDMETGNEAAKSESIIQGAQSTPIKNPASATAKDLAAQIVPTTIPNTNVQQERASEVNISVGSIDQDGVLLKLLHTKLGSSGGISAPTSKDTDVDNKQAAGHDDSSSGSDVLDMDESSSASIESASATSSLMSEVDPGNLTLSDGKMDKEKMSSLSFPTANISKSLEKSFAKMKKGIKKGRDLSHSDVPSSSTPAPVSTVMSRRRTSKRHADQKAKTDALLAELGL